MRYEEVKSIFDSIRMPELNGSEKQIAWANKIRVEKLNPQFVESSIMLIRKNFAGQDTSAKEKMFVVLLQEFVDRHADSKFWIENRAINTMKIQLMISRKE